jgi:hypothetical protein
MEAMHQLTGVTTHEPGVSRIDEAVRLACAGREIPSKKIRTGISWNGIRFFGVVRFEDANLRRHVEVSRDTRRQENGCACSALEEPTVLDTEYDRRSKARECGSSMPPTFRSRAAFKSSSSQVVPRAYAGSRERLECGESRLGGAIRDLPQECRGWAAAKAGSCSEDSTPTPK